MLLNILIVAKTTSLLLISKTLKTIDTTKNVIYQILMYIMEYNIIKIICFRNIDLELFGAT